MINVTCCIIGEMSNNTCCIIEVITKFTFCIKRKMSRSYVLDAAGEMSKIFVRHYWGIEQTIRIVSLGKLAKQRFVPLMKTSNVTCCYVSIDA